MNSTAKRLAFASPSSTALIPMDALFAEGYQEALAEAVAAEDYKKRDEPSSTAEGYLTRRNSTVVASSVGSVRNSGTRVAEWDGYVIEVGAASFTAGLLGIAGEDVEGESHDAEIALEDVGAADRTLLRPGACFRLCIYLQVDDDDRPKRYAKVIFRRLPAYRQTELARADARADERHSKLRVE